VRVIPFVVGAILLSLPCARAFAESADGGPEPDPPPSHAQSQSQVPPPALPTQSESHDHCRADAELASKTDAMFEKARAAYEANDKEQSIFWLTRSYEVSSCAEFLFIVGELNREQGHSCLAYRSYQKYLRELPDGRNAANAGQLIEELASSCERSVPAPVVQPVGPVSTPHSVEPGASRPSQSGEPPRSAPPTSSTTWTPSRAVGWASLGAGLIAGAAAVYYATVEQSAENDLEALWKSRVAGQTSSADWQANSNSLESKGLRAERAARILGISAGALAVGGALLVIWGHRPEGQTTAARVARRVDLQFSPQSMHAGYTVHF